MVFINQKKIPLNASWACPEDYLLKILNPISPNHKSFCSWTGSVPAI